MPLFGPKKRKVLVAEEHTGPMDRKVYDYRDMDVHVSGHERDEGEVQVRDYDQTRRVRAKEDKPHWYSLHRKKESPTFMEKAGEAAGEQADFMEK